MSVSRNLLVIYDRTGCRTAIPKFPSLMYVHVPKMLVLP